MGMHTGDILPADLLQPKNYDTFVQRMGRRSQNVGELARTNLKILTRFLKTATVDDTIQVIKAVDPYDLIDAYIGWLTKEGYNGNTINNLISTAKKWMRYQGVKIYNEELRERTEMPRAEEAADDPITKETIRQIISTMDFHSQNRMLLLTCSGIRPCDINFLQPSDFKWNERPVRLIVPAKGKTKRGWETFVTNELADRLRNNGSFFKQHRPDYSHTLSIIFWNHVTAHQPQLIVTNKSLRGARGNRRKIHLYSLRKFFFSQCTTVVGDAIAHAWMGRKAYLSNYLRLPLEERQRLYLKVMPRLSVFTAEPPTTEDRLRERLKTKFGLTDEKIDQVLEGLVLA